MSSMVFTSDIHHFMHGFMQNADNINDFSYHLFSLLP